MTLDHRHPGLAFAKPAPRAVVRHQRKAAHEAETRRQDAIVKKRSGGRCEVSVGSRALAGPRCTGRAVHIHHILGGNGRRDRGLSQQNQWKLHLCTRCHTAIHDGRLVVTGSAGAWRFEERG